MRYVESVWGRQLGPLDQMNKFNLNNFLVGFLSGGNAKSTHPEPDELLFNGHELFLTVLPPDTFRIVKWVGPIQSCMDSLRVVTRLAQFLRSVGLVGYLLK